MPSLVFSPLSGARSDYLFSSRVLGRYNADYFMDPQARFIFVKQPHWLEEAYSTDAISAIDTGVLARNLGNIEIVTRLLDFYFPDQKGVDLGGGSGIFVRGMRDEGFNFFWSDKYARNLLARGFEATPGDYPFAVAFEVLEHTLNPLEFLTEKKNEFNFESLCFSATCFDPDNIPSKNWSYWSFESGQHISFFSQYTLNWLAEKLKFKLSHVNADIFVMAPEYISECAKRMRPPLIERILCRALRYAQRGRLKSRYPLTYSDHLAMAQLVKRGSNIA